jgi:hypothetical protein
VFATRYAHPYPQYLWIKIDSVQRTRSRRGRPIPFVLEFPRLAEFMVAG